MFLLCVYKPPASQFPNIAKQRLQLDASSNKLFVFQGFVSFLLPCFAVDHLYLSDDDYLFSEEDTPITEGGPSLHCPTPRCLFTGASY